MFAVITHYTFDPDVKVSEGYFSKEDATAAMVKDAQNEYRIAIKENERALDDVFFSIDEECGIASMSTFFLDGTKNTMVWTVVEIPDSKFPLPECFGRMKIVPHPDKTLEYPGIVVNAEFNRRPEYGTGIWVEEGTPETLTDSKEKELHVFVYSPTCDEPFARVVFPGYEAVDDPEDITGSDGPNAVKTHFGVLTAEPVSKRGVPGVQIILTSRGQQHTLVKMFQYVVPSGMDMAVEFQILIYDKNKPEPTQVYTFREPVFEPITIRLIADLGNGEPTLDGDRTSRYFEIARGCGEKARKTIEVAIVEQKANLPESDWGYALHLINNITMEDCQTFYTEHLDSEELDELLKKILSGLKKQDVGSNSKN